MSPLHARPRLRNCLVGANPIIWSNDDFADLCGDVPLDTILGDMRAAGFAGTELGHAYPRTADALGAALVQHDLQLASGWHSTFFATGDHTEELDKLRRHLRLLRILGAEVAIVAECSHCIHGDKERALGFGPDDRPGLDEAGWARLVQGLQRACEVAVTEDIRLVYHHHMGTVVQTAAELDRLLDQVPALQLVLDPGHLAFAGIDPVAVAERHGARVGHVHLKSVRADIAARVRVEGWSFYRAVREGVFTIPGEGMVDFPAIFARLAERYYRGWLIVEAEEDPARVPALPKARRAREAVREMTGL